MSIFEELKSKLSTDWPGELWDEHGRQVCADLFQHITPADRTALLESATMQPSPWQSRLLSVLALGDPDTAISVARRLLERSDAEVVLAAGDVLRALQVNGIEWPAHAKQLLEAVAQNSASRIDRLRAAELLRIAKG